VYSSNTDVSNILTANNLLVSGNLIFANSSVRRVGINAVPTGTATLQVGGDASVAGNISATSLSVSTVAATGNTFAFNGGQISSNGATVAATSTPQLIDSFPKAAAKLAKYHIRVANTTNGIHGAEVLLAHEGTNVLMTVYGEVFGSELGTFDATINGANVELTYTGTIGETVKLVRTQVLE
jgi:hypothetical protein